MEENSRKINIVVVIIDGLLTVGCILWLFNSLLHGGNDFPHNIEIVTDIIASSVAFSYLIAGYTKGISNYYKHCLILAVIHAVAVAIIACGESYGILSFIMCLMAAIVLSILAFVKDLGKTVSYILCGLLLFIRATGLGSVFPAPGLGFKDPKFPLIWAQLVLAITITIITYAKYKDKTSRGTK